DPALGNQPFNRHVAFGMDHEQILPADDAVSAAELVVGPVSGDTEDAENQGEEAQPREAIGAGPVAAEPDSQAIGCTEDTEADEAADDSDAQHIACFDTVH